MDILDLPVALSNLYKTLHTRNLHLLLTSGVLDQRKISGFLQGNGTKYSNCWNIDRHCRTKAKCQQCTGVKSHTVHNGDNLNGAFNHK